MVNVEKKQTVTNALWGSRPSTVIPTSRYKDPEFAQLENEQLWPKVWQYACRLEEVPNTGDFLEYKIADRSILIVRVDSETVKAYVNSCLHRGTQLKKGCGTLAAITCPFHSWSWAIDGSLARITSPEDFSDVDPEEMRLPECKVAIWAGFVFINPSPYAEPFEQFIAPIDELVAPYHVEQQRISSHTLAMVPCNWKVAAESAEEAYHVPFLHPQMAVGVDDVTAIYEVLGRHARYALPLGTPTKRMEGVSDLDALEAFLASFTATNFAGEDQKAALKLIQHGELPEGMEPRAVFLDIVKSGVDERLSGLGEDALLNLCQFSIFPNVTVNCLPGKTLVIRCRPDGSDPESSTYEVLSLDLVKDGEDPPTYEPEWLDDPVHKGWPASLEATQDLSLFPRVQAGMHSTEFVRFAGYQEQGLANRHRVLDEMMNTFPSW